MIHLPDFRSIKRGVKLESVLRHYHVKLRRTGKDQYRGCCPIHRGEGRDAFHVNLARNIFHCFACGAAGTVLDFVAAMDRCSVFGAAQKLQAMTDSSVPTTSIPNEKELVTKGKQGSFTPALRVGPALTAVTLAERGITEQTAWHFGAGSYAGPGLMHRRMVIPIHNAEGLLIAYCGRSMDQTQPRYRVLPAFSKSEILFQHAPRRRRRE
jgi:DNA primase